MLNNRYSIQSISETTIIVQSIDASVTKENKDISRRNSDFGVYIEIG